MAKGTSAQGLATHYALVATNPFVLTGANYNAFLGNGALERFDPTGGTVKITDEYLDDRINFLERTRIHTVQAQESLYPVDPFSKTNPIISKTPSPAIKSSKAACLPTRRAIISATRKLTTPLHRR